jgi:predicted glycoside hydrolase/deacetylase ChbG (UPF0249 family)
MAAGKYFSQAAHLAFTQPALAVGCHVVLVDGTPTLRTSEVTSLLGPSRNGFRPTIGSFVSDLLRGRIEPHEIEAEAVAQIRKIQSSGMTVSHIDAHKHMHMFPRVLAPMLRAAVACGVPCIRNPFEPGWSLRATQGSTAIRRTQVYLLRSYRRKFLRMVREHGLETTDGAIGVLATGSLDADVLHSLLGAIPVGTWELVCHPGYHDEALEKSNTRLIDAREVERVALLEVVPEMIAGDAEITLIDFHGLSRNA